MIGKNGVSLLIGHNGVQDKTTLDPANETVARGIYDATTLSTVDAELATANIKNGITIFGFAGSADVWDISDATAIEAEVLDPETFYAVGGGIRTGTMPTVAIVAANDNYPAGYHVGNVGGLDAIEVNLAAANILSGVNIFGFVGPATVQDIADADAAVGDVKDPKTFYSVTGARKTGTMATVTLIADNTAYPAGYHAGAANLATIEAHLAAGNIRSGVNIFGYVGAATVQDISAADLTVAEAPTGKTFFAVTGGIKTGTGTKTLNPANEDVLAGYYAVTTLSAVDAQLAAANIKSGINIFGFVGVATVQDIADANAVLADVKNGKTFYSVTGGRKTGNLATVAIVADNNAYPAGYHAGAANLAAIDAQLAAANILSGVNIFGYVGVATVQEIGAADAVLADVKNGKTFFSVTGGIKTGNLATVALAAGSNAYPAGYHVGDVGGLDAIDVDLVTANIKSGITIFNVAGHNDVRNISDADLLEAEAPTGKFFYAVAGGRRTGTGTKTLNPANENVVAGYYAVTTLSTVDAQLAAANILSGVNIFGFVGVATVQDIADANAVLADVMNGKTFYSVTGGRKTGNLATVAITAANDNYPAGYHAGNVGGLDAIDADLAPGNIKDGVTIFGKLGTYEGLAPTLTKLPMNGPATTGGRVTCNTNTWFTETIPAPATDVYIWYAFYRTSGTWTFRLKYKGVMKVEQTGFSGAGPAGIHWAGAGDGGGDAVWETHCEGDGGGMNTGSGCYITMA